MTDITELAQSLKAAAENAIGAHERLAAYPYGEIIDISQHEGEQIDIDITDLNEFHEEANPVNVIALVEALEKAQRANSYLREQSAEWERKAISNFEDCAEMSARIEELESQRRLAFTAYNRWADKFRESEKRVAELEIESAVKDASNLELKQQYQRLLESRTVTDWIEHDGKWRPESLGLDELVYLKTRKQELKIPYPAGKVKGWTHRGCAMDVMAYKLASPQDRTVAVKLPDLRQIVSGDRYVWSDGIFNYSQDVKAILAAAGIKVEAE